MDNMSRMSGKRRINGSVAKALSLLDAFGADREELTAAQLAEITGLSRGSLYPIVHALEESGYLQRVSPRAYTIGFRVVELANVVLRRLDIQESVRPFLQRLAADLKVNAHLGILNGCEALHLHREIGADAVVVGEIVGWRAPAYCTALGKILLAQLPRCKLREVLSSQSLAPHTAATITDLNRLVREIQAIAETGYAVSREEYHEGIVGIAAAVRDALHDVDYAISISVTRPRFDREEEGLVRAVRQAAAGISDRLRARVPEAATSSADAPRD
jgi:DNA-binding IclR family transcriptional regulator